MMGIKRANAPAECSGYCLGCDLDCTWAFNKVPVPPAPVQSAEELEEIKDALDMAEKCGEETKNPTPWQFNTLMQVRRAKLAFDSIESVFAAQRQAGREEERQAMRQRYEEWSEGREKGAYEQGRQAGREEMLDAVTESLDSSYAKGVADTDAHYAELVEAAREVSRWITLYAVGPGIVEVSVKIAKALRDLDNAKGGNNA